MSTIKAELMGLLLTDNSLMAALPGGLYDLVTLDGTAISRASAPPAFDANGELVTCAGLRIETDVKDGPFWAPDASARLFFHISFYKDDGTARARAFALLHYNKLPAAKVFEIRWVNDTVDAWDDVLKVALRQSRYEVFHA